MKTLKQISEELEQIKTTSKWKAGVKEYAEELINQAIENHGADKILSNSTSKDEENVLNLLLNGAESWQQYSWGGCALIYNGDIAERLCTPSELKRVKGGELQPNKYDEWLDVQTRALIHAEELIFRIIKG